MASERAFAAVIGASWLLVAHVQAENVNCPCDSVIPNGVGLVNLRVDSSAFDQIETTIDVVDLGATSKILSGYITQWGANCNPRDIVRQVGFAYSTNSGTNWSGGDTLPPGSSLKLADPWLGISGYDTAYYCYLEGPLGSKRLKLDWSGDWGATWHGPVVLDSLYDPDKPALATGFVPFHPDSGLLHIAYWATGPIRYGRSTDGGRSFSFEWFSNGTGPSIAVNRLGWVYVVWTHAGSPGRGVKIRMSVNGGTTFNPEVTVNAGHPAVVHQLPLKPLWVKGQGFPVVAADTSGGEFDIHDSTVYIAWAGLKYGPLETPDTASATPNYDPDIFFTKSTDAGQLWLSTPKRINNDAIGNGRDQWMPAMDVDLYGGINIVFYDSRNDWRDQMTEVYLARSIDGGESFTNFPISTVKFKPCNANGRCSGPAGNGPGFCTDGATAFIGDYISITSDSSTLYACWADNRFRRMGADSSVFQYYQAVVAPIPILDTLRGTLASSRTINGPCVLEGDVTVNPSCTLSVKKGSWLIVRADSDQTPSSYGIDADRTEIIVRPGGVLNIESTGPGRPVFTSTNKTRGSWYGIRVLNGGSIKGGIGARIEYAQVGLTIDTVTTADTLRGPSVPIIVRQSVGMI